MRQRVARVAEEMRAAAAEVLRELKDPRVGFASVVRAEVSGDLRHVKLHVSVLGPEAEQEATLAALERARGFVRTELGRRVRLYHTPEVHFVLDTSIAHGDRIARLLGSLASARGGAAPEGATTDDDGGPPPP
jgi:ribosome-binding factor A